MQLFTKTICFMLVLCAIPGADAATSRAATDTSARVSAASVASRAPKIVLKNGTTSTTTTTTTTTSSSLLANSACIDAYSECIKADDACGPNFEECTTRVLFHAQMPNCLGTLAQCSSDGVNSLFGTSNVSALADGVVKDAYGDITDYRYPLSGSVLGQMIDAAAIANQYDTSTCVRRYTTCLKKDTVCGEDFELCTTKSEFKKQRVFCDSTLARCQGEGVKELLGDASRTATPTDSSRVGEMIAEGAALAAVAAVSTCYKVVDQCILNACSQNPYKCTAGVSEATTKIADAIKAGQTVTDEDISAYLSSQRSASDVSGYIRNACFSTIGTNKYCYATFIGDGKMPTNSQMRDEDNQDIIYDAAYNARMNASLKSQIADLLNKFDEKTKSQCVDTIKSCAMRVCGGGSGAACYAAVYGSGGLKSINARGNASQVGPYDEIKSGCEAIVSTDTSCKYAASNPNTAGTYSYTYINNSAFDTLFPEYDGGAEKDVIGVIASLNASLATSYNDAAIANMKRQCANIAKGCITSMCGSEYTNCYRNRTDIVSGTYDTGNSNVDRSMNKMGGVLDNNIVIGLCLDTVKNATACEDHLAIQSAKMVPTAQSGWGDSSSVRDAWLGSNTAKVTDTYTDTIETGYCTASNANTNPKCDDYTQQLCNTVDSDGCVYDAKVYETFTEYALNTSAKTVLQEVVADVEKEAQAKYNAKLTREQNMCMSSNAGGIIGAKDLGSTFMWAKLKTSKVPTDYTVNGLKQTAFTASNDLYGSFCRVRVTIQSDDKKIQEAMKGNSWTTAYFATGDSFTCGSWIPERDLNEIADAVASDKAGSINDASLKRTRFWTGVLGGVAGGIGGIALGEGIRNGNILGGLTGLTGNEKKVVADPATSAKACLEQIESFGKADKVQERKRYAQGAAKYAEAAGANSVDVKNVKDLAEKYECDKYNGGKCATKDAVSSREISSDDVAMETLLGMLKKQCEEQQDAKPTEKAKSNWGITAGSAVISTLVGGWTVYKATKDIQQSELDAEQKAAYTEWMNNVGRHITCFIGGDEAGSYGDIITTSLE